MLTMTLGLPDAIVIRKEYFLIQKNKIEHKHFLLDVTLKNTRLFTQQICIAIIFVSY